VTTLTLLLFTCVVLHELGHCVVAQRLGSRVMGITLLPIGGVASMASLPERPRDEAWVAIAGPLVNVVIVLGLLPWLGWSAAYEGWNTLPRSAADLPGALLRANLVLVAFNLIPAFPMDGGRLLRAGLACFLPYARATALAARIGQVVALLFIAMGLGGMPMLTLVGAFVFVAAGRESGVIQLRETWSGRLVRDVMRPAHILAAGDEVLVALARAHAGMGTDFVVTEGEGVLGILPHARWLAHLQGAEARRPVAEIMLKGFVTVRPDADAGRAWFELGRHGHSMVPVLDDGRLVGVLDLPQLAREQARARDLPSDIAGRRVDLG
jgi:Zn-dependent protease/CBS domain-containing protein